LPEKKVPVPFFSIRPMKPEGRREPGEVAVGRRELAPVLDGESG
jgi:hypothetical protein